MLSYGCFPTVTAESVICSKDYEAEKLKTFTIWIWTEKVF